MRFLFIFSVSHLWLKYKKKRWRNRATIPPQKQRSAGKQRYRSRITYRPWKRFLAVAPDPHIWLYAEYFRCFARHLSHIKASFPAILWKRYQRINKGFLRYFDVLFWHENRKIPLNHSFFCDPEGFFCRGFITKVPPQIKQLHYNIHIVNKFF